MRPCPSCGAAGQNNQETCPGCGAGGADESALQTGLGMNTLGFGHQVSAGNRIADDFDVIDSGGWDVQMITFFAYQTGSGPPSTITAVNHIGSIYFQVAANFNFNKIETITMVIFPAILPEILPALRISLGIAWLVVVAAEMIAVKSGLGYLILDSRNALRMDYVMDAMIAIGIIGICLDRLIVQLNRIKAVEWGSV